MLRFNMSEFSETISITSLIGAPAGYVGYREGGALTDTVSKKPYSVILFDNADKAHPKVLSLITEIVENGSLTDATGRAISFKNNIIIISVTIDNDNIEKDNLGFDINENKNEENGYMGDLLREYLGTELVNKVDKVVVFSNLKDENLVDVCKLKLESLKKFLPAGYTLNYNKEIIQKIIDIVKQEKNSNAKGIDEVITEKIENKLIDLLVERGEENNKTIYIDYKNKDFNLVIK